MFAKRSILAMALAIGILLTACSSGGGKKFNVEIGGYKGTFVVAEAGFSDEHESVSGSAMLLVTFGAKGTDVLAMNGADLDELKESIYVSNEAGEYPLAALAVQYSKEDGYFPQFGFEVPEESEVASFTLHVDGQSAALQ